MTSNFYILAMGRSGTTLLQNILNCHPQIVMPPESFFVLHLGTKYGSIENWTEDVISNFILDLYTDRPFKIFWQTPLEDVKSSFARHGTVKSFAEACNVVRRSYQQSFMVENIKYVGDKNPIYCLYSKKLLEITPSAKIIHLVRDPRGTANGQINTFKRKNAFLVGLQWTNYNKNLLRIASSHPDQYLRVRYEDLIENTKQEVKNICDFLGLEFSEDMLDYREKVVEKFKDYSGILNYRHQSLLKPIDKKIAEKWRTGLDQTQIDKIKYTTGVLGNKLGYDMGVLTKNWKYSVSCFLTKFIAYFRLVTVRVYFLMPFFIRKKILQIRSKNSDHKYINSEH